MSKTILITGSTDGIGLETVKMLAEKGENIIIHGRNKKKVKKVEGVLKEINNTVEVKSIVADLSELDKVREMAEILLKECPQIDVLINNAGVLVVDNTKTKDNLETRFVVNTIAPYLLTKLLLPIIKEDGRIINLSSAAQSPVDLPSLKEWKPMSHDEAYAQSKLAIAMWSIELAKEHKDGPSILAVNPKSFLGSKMVKEAYKTEGHDLRIGADLLTRMAISKEFEDITGKYYDNDFGHFDNPHPYALDDYNRAELIRVMDEILEEK